MARVLQCSVGPESETRSLKVENPKSPKVTAWISMKGLWDSEVSNTSGRGARTPILVAVAFLLAKWSTYRKHRLDQEICRLSPQRHGLLPALAIGVYSSVRSH